MNIYIEHEGKFYNYPLTWDKIKNHPIESDFIPRQPTDNPQFTPGDRVWFEDLKEWTEVVSGDCRKCVWVDEDCVSKRWPFLCAMNASKHISFRKLNTGKPKLTKEQAAELFISAVHTRCNSMEIQPELVNKFMEIQPEVVNKFYDDLEKSGYMEKQETAFERAERLYKEWNDCPREDCNIMVIDIVNAYREDHKEMQAVIENEPAAPAAILDSERNRIAYGFMQSLLNDSPIYPENDTMNIYATDAFRYADAFIARAKQEDK